MQPLSGQLLELLITPEKEDLSTPIEHGRFDFEGLVGDRHYGITSLPHGSHTGYPKGTVICNRRQVSILSQEDLREVAADLKIEKIDIRWLAGNLLVKGLQNLSLLPLGSRLFFANGVVLVCNGENDPCSLPARITQENNPQQPEVKTQFIKAAMHKRGITAWVEHPGQMLIGESFQVELPKPWHPYWMEFLEK